MPLCILYGGGNDSARRRIDTWENVAAADRFVAALSMDKVGRLDARNRGLLILTVAAWLELKPPPYFPQCRRCISDAREASGRRVRQRAAGIIFPR